MNERELNNQVDVNDFAHELTDEALDRDSSALWCGTTPNACSGAQPSQQIKTQSEMAGFFFFDSQAIASGFIWIALMRHNLCNAA